MKRAQPIHLLAVVDLTARGLVARRGMALTWSPDEATCPVCDWKAPRRIARERKET